MNAISNTASLQAAPGVTLDIILDTVCDRLDRSRTDVIGGDDRSATTLRARHVAMWLACRLLKLSYAEIGRLIGGRDGGVVENAQARIEALRVSDLVARAQLAAIDLEIRAAGGASVRLGRAFRPAPDAVQVARRVMGDARAATRISVAEIEALAAYVLQHHAPETSHD